MPLTYALVARLDHTVTVLCEHGSDRLGGDFRQIARSALEKTSQKVSRESFPFREWTFHLIKERGLAFLCMAAADDGARLPFAFLTEVMSRFFAAYPTEWKTASDLQLDAFGRVLQSRMEFFNNDPEADKIRRVRGEVDKVKTVMLDNIEKVIARGDNIEELVDKTYQLSSSSQEFRVQSKHLEKRLCCKNAKMTAILISVCVVVAIGILLIILWQLHVFDGSKSTSPPAESTTAAPATTAAPTTTLALTTTAPPTTAAATTTTTTVAATTTTTTTLAPSTSTSTVAPTTSTAAPTTAAQ